MDSLRTTAATIDPGTDAPGLTDDQAAFLLGCANQLATRSAWAKRTDIADMGSHRARMVTGFVVARIDGEPSRWGDGCPSHDLVVADLTGTAHVRTGGRTCGVCLMAADGYVGPVEVDGLEREPDGRWRGDVWPTYMDPAWDEDFAPGTDADALESSVPRPLRRRRDAAGRRAARVPDLLGTPPAALVYRGRRTLVTGKPDQGKTWLSLAAAADVIHRRRGPVLWFDCDQLGDDVLIDRMNALGVCDAHLEAWFRVGLLGAGHEDTREEARTLFPALVVFDGWNAALSKAGVSPLDESGVIQWQRACIDPFLRVRPGCAVIVNDHVPQRAGADHAYAFGAQGKVGQVDAHLRVGWAPGRRMDQAAGHGRLEVRVMRDRNGGHHAGGYLVDLSPTAAEPVGITRATLATGRDVSGEVVAALKGMPGASTSALHKATGVKRETLLGVLRMMEAAGSVTREKGPRNADLWTLVAGDEEGGTE